MSTPVSLGNFSVILARTKAVLANGKEIPDPFLGATSLDVFRQAVADGRDILPARYQSRYVDVLESLVDQAEAMLRRLHPRDGARRRHIFEQLQAVFSIIAAPIVQLKSKQHQRELKAFQAEISNIYRRFINHDLVQRGARVRMLSPDLDPLGAFGHDPTGPFTLAASDDLPVAIVSKPANEMHALPLWAADGHEVGGHNIYGAVRGFEKELERVVEEAIRDAFRSGQVVTSVSHVDLPVRLAWYDLVGWLLGTRRRRVTMEEFMVQVWKAWLCEASSDAAGLANLGPMYLDSLLLILGALRPNSRLGVQSVFDLDANAARQGFEEHPVDVERVLLAIETLKLLNFSRGAEYAAAFMQRLQELYRGSVPQVIRWVDTLGNTIVTLPRSDFQAVLPVVAKAVMRAKLSSLAGQAFSDIVNWTDVDEQIVMEVASKLIAGDTECGDHVEARHVVSASMLAAEECSRAGGAGFGRALSLIHETGVSMLAEMYDAECILCIDPHQHGKGSRARETDITRIFNHIKSHLRKALAPACTNAYTW